MKYLIVFLLFTLLSNCTSIEKQKDITQPIGRQLIIDSTSLKNIKLAPSLSLPLELILQITVDQNGIIKSISIDKSTGFRNIDDEIIDAVSIWRFESTVLTEPNIHSVVFTIINGRITTYFIYQLNRQSK